ncbi:MAG: DnaA N-terminal domain-containing protein, partial [Fimbriimonadaceae bacterium]
MSDQYSLEDQEDVVVLKSAWQQVLSRFEQELPESVNRRFIKPLKPESIEGGKVYISAPGQFVQEWV